MSNKKQINRSKLYESYPKLAAILDNIYENSKQSNYWFFVNYRGKYTDRNGKPRAVSMGAVLDILEEHGYEIEINANQKKLRKTISNN